MKKLGLTLFSLCTTIALLSACGSSELQNSLSSKSDLDIFQGSGTLYTSEQIDDVLHQGLLGTNATNAVVPLAFDNAGNLLKLTEEVQSITFTPYFMSTETYNQGLESLGGSDVTTSLRQVDSSTAVALGDTDLNSEFMTYIDVYDLDINTVSSPLQASAVAEAIVTPERFWIKRLGYGEPTDVCWDAYYFRQGVSAGWYCGWSLSPLTRNQICQATYGSQAFSSWYNWWTKKPYCKEHRWG